MTARRALLAALAAAAVLAPTAGAAGGVGILRVRIVDPARTVRLPGGRLVPRTLVTVVRYPTASGTDVPGARPAAGRLPLVVFGHGFRVTPETYTALLRAWARAGYVVAAPVFPLENANAPGGPDEADIVNQPADVRLVISRLLDPRGPLGTLVDPSRVAVAGHSDGAETALAVALGRRTRDSRVRAAVILAGSELPGDGGLASSPVPLLAEQGTADRINPPSLTAAYLAHTPRPRFLLELPGAGHLEPVTTQQPQLGVVERTTLAFLDHYLRGAPLSAIAAAGNVPGVARLASAP